jgi:phenylalanyl-tRNA synthetase alpha chain
MSLDKQNKLWLKMQDKIDQVKNDFDQKLQTATSVTILMEVKTQFLGKKGPVQELMKYLKDVPSDLRPNAGKQINDLKTVIENAIDQRLHLLEKQEQDKQLSDEFLDVTLPGRRDFSGRKHIITKILDEMVSIHQSMGFSVQLGPDIDTDFYNFEALNFPPDHPARDMQDTFYLAPDVLLRTHTSNVQIRIMEKTKPPIRIIAPGKVYRNETITARSHVFFHQVEALYIDKNVSFVDLLSSLDIFFKKFFKTDVKTRFRPSFFPFVEPGMEVDVSCLACKGSGCPLCKHSGWLEVAGAGMVHPEVLKYGNIDPEEYSGFAWGMGVERLCMLKTGIPDIRLFAENDIRFNRQFVGV